MECKADVFHLLIYHTRCLRIRAGNARFTFIVELEAKVFSCRRQIPSSLVYSNATDDCQGYISPREALLTPAMYDSILRFPTIPSILHGNDNTVGRRLVFSACIAVMLAVFQIHFWDSEWWFISRREDVTVAKAEPCTRTGIYYAISKIR